MTVPKCMFNYELLVAYASGNVDSRERAVAEKHLAQCPNCRREVRALEETWWSLDTWQEELESVKPRVLDLRQRIEASKKQEAAWRHWLEACHRVFFSLRLRPVMAFAAASLALLIFPWINNQPDPLPSASSLVADSGSIGRLNPDPKPTLISYNRPSPEARIERDFAQALQRSAMEEQTLQSQQVHMRLNKSGSLEQVQLLNVGFSPSASEVPVYPSGQALQPSAHVAPGYNESLSLQ